MTEQNIKKITYGRQSISQDDINAVVDVLNSDYLTQGPLIERFEQQICEYTGAKFCAVVANGTAALHLAVKALGIQKGAKGITSPISFLASANCLLYNDLAPAFSDIELDSVCMDPDLLSRHMDDKTKLVIPVHFAGQPCDMVSISTICREKGLHIIEDAAHALGSKYEDGSMVGNCRYSDMTIFSFHPVKTITTGEGGAVTTNDENLYKKIKLLANHGVTRNPEEFQYQSKRGFSPWHYEMQELGFNYRITDLQCALGISQLKRIEKFIRYRKEIAACYNMHFADLDKIKTPDSITKGESSWHLYTIQVKGIDRKALYEQLAQKGIITNVHYTPIYLQPYYRKNFGFKPGDFPASEAYYNTALTLPLFSAMTDAEVDTVIKSVKEAV